MSSPAEKALRLLKYLPRFSLNNITRNPYAPAKRHKQRGKSANRGWRWSGHKTLESRQMYLPVGFELGKFPWYMKMPKEPYYKDFLHRRQYPPMTLYELQFLIDTGKLNIDEPIDLTSLCNTNCYHIRPLDNHYGVQLKDDGIDVFRSQINLEVQHANEPVIAAIERNGGVITTAYYDINSVLALADPLKFFKKGQPIPKRMLPPPDCIEYYSDPKNRGYLANPDEIARERFLLAQKYGYELPDLTKDPKCKMLLLRKDPRQVFLGLEPGWVVNLKDKEILRPTNEALEKYYKN